MTVRLVLAGYGDVGGRKFTPALFSFAEKSARRDYSFVERGERIELLVIDVDPGKAEAVEEVGRRAAERGINLDVSFACPRGGALSTPLGGVKVTKVWVRRAFRL